jgi:hypothetical protein
MSDRFGSRMLPRKARVVGLVVGAFAALAVAAPSASAGTISPGTGPVDEIRVNNQLGCQLIVDSHLMFDTGAIDMDNYCGTFVALEDIELGDQVYGDETADELVDSPYEEVSQSAVTGMGTAAAPFKLTTVVEVPVVVQPVRANDAVAVPAQDGESQLTITETESYVEGDDFYRTDITVHNDTGDELDPVLYHAGDCFMGSDVGYAANDTAQSGAVFCVPNQQLDTSSTVPQPGNSPGILGFVPIGGDSNYRETYAGEGDGTLFEEIDGSAFSNVCDNCHDPTEFDPVDNGTGLSWELFLPGGGSATRCFYTVASANNSVPDIPSGCTPTESGSPPATVAQKPSTCKLRISRARVFLFKRHPRLRLVARYRSAEPADVQINFKAIENGEKVDLGDVTRHFHRHGLFRLPKALTEQESDALWETHKFIVRFKIPGEPGFCERKYKKELTVPRIIDGQRVVFQSDSKFTGGPGHPEH